MPYSIVINGVDRTSDVISESVLIEDALNDKQNTCRFSLFDRNSLGFPSPDQEVIITLNSGTKIFGGYITEVERSKFDTGGVRADISCIDYVLLFDRNLVHSSYEDMTDAAIISDIVSTYCSGSGITTTNVVSGVTIKQITFNYLQPSQCLRKICELTGRNWYIDYNKDIHYFPNTQSPAPFNITDTPNVAYTRNENMQSIPSGTFSNNATYDSVNDWVRLTSAANNESGAVTWQQTLPESMTMYSEFWIGGGSGADAFYMYYGANSIQLAEDSTGKQGWCIAADEYEDQIQILFNGTKLASVAQASLDNSTWRSFQVDIVRSGNNTQFTVKLAGTTVLTYTDTTSRVLGGNYYGFGARTGGLSNEHRCRSFQVYSSTYNLGYDYKNLRITSDAAQVKNRIYVRGGTYLSDETTYEEKGDAKKRIFPLPEKPHEVTVKVNGTTKTLGIKNIDLSGYDWYLNFQEKYIEQDAGGTVLGTGDTLTVLYKYDIPILIAQEDTASIASHGVKEYAIFDKSITTKVAARDRAIAELTDFANNLIDGSFTTWTDGFRSGQYITINLSSYGVNADYVIQKVSARSMGAGKYSYNIQLASSKSKGIIRFLIELLEANKNLIELNDDEVVDELLSVSDSLLSDSLTDTLTIDSAAQYSTWCNASESSPTTRARWDLFQWGT